MLRKTITMQTELAALIFFQDAMSIHAKMIWRMNYLQYFV
jgi:hypothetical protein